MSEVEAPEKKKRGGNAVLWWLAIILAVPIIYLALGAVFFVDPDNSTASERPTYTPEEPTASATAVQTDAQEQEKLSETAVPSTPAPVTSPSPSPVPSAAAPSPMVTTTVPIPLSQADRAAIWIGLVDHEYGFLDVFARVNFKVDAFDLDVFVHGEAYCNDRVLDDDEPPTKLSCGILEYTHSSVSDVRVRVNEDSWSEGDRYRCERNKASTDSRSVFACERVRP